MNFAKTDKINYSMVSDSANGIWLVSNYSNVDVEIFFIFTSFHYSADKKLTI